VQKP